MIEVRELRKAFGETNALDGLSFTVKEGVAFGLLGRNGAGKTTSMRILMNVFHQDSGTASFDGLPASKSPKRIGYLPEERGLYLKVRIIDQMVFLGRLRGLTAARAKEESTELLKELEASEYKDKKLMTLSKGNQQKIQLAIALLGEPEIVILDEPFSGLDPVNARLLKDLVRNQAKKGKTVIFSSHQMAQVEEFCDDICIIDRGKDVLSGNLANIKKSYPRNRIVVDPGIGSPPDIKQRLKTALDIEEIKDRPEGAFEVILKDPGRRGELLAALTAMGVVPETFSVQEPSLEEIFVEKVGRGEEAN